MRLLGTGDLGAWEGTFTEHDRKVKHAKCTCVHGHQAAKAKAGKTAHARYSSRPTSWLYSSTGGTGDCRGYVQALLPGPVNSTVLRKVCWAVARDHASPSTKRATAVSCSSRLARACIEQQGPRQVNDTAAVDKSTESNHHRSHQQQQQ